MLSEISETHGIAAWFFLGSEASFPCLFADTGFQGGTVTAVTISVPNMVTALFYFFNSLLTWSFLWFAGKVLLF